MWTGSTRCSGVSGKHHPLLNRVVEEEVEVEVVGGGGGGGEWVRRVSEWSLAGQSPGSFFAPRYHHVQMSHGEITSQLGVYPKRKYIFFIFYDSESIHNFQKLLF